MLDPLDTLTFVASHTKTIRLGTSVLDMPYHNLVVLARRLTTFDVFANGRLCVGVGLEWNKDEMDATGADMKKRGALADEFLPLLKASWISNPVEFTAGFLKTSQIGASHGSDVRESQANSERVWAQSDSMGMIVHAFLELTEKPLDKVRNIFSGPYEQIAEDARGWAKIGAQETFLNPTSGMKASPLIAGCLYGNNSVDRWMSRWLAPLRFCPTC